jgi:hypothetical protein
MLPLMMPMQKAKQKEVINRLNCYNPENPFINMEGFFYLQVSP